MTAHVHGAAPADVSTAAGIATSGSATRLRSAGIRVTKPRIAVLDVLEEARPRHEHLSAATVEERVRARIGAISTQGVYDCLEALEAAHLLRTLEPAGQPALYESRVNDNHHHLVCRSCNLVTDIDCVVGESACLTPSSTNGFVVDEAEVTFWGLCPSCAASSAPAERP
ncbi:Fur family transcriptional regulator [Microbacteriaceae bacterium 4G12]